VTRFCPVAQALLRFTILTFLPYDLLRAGIHHYAGSVSHNFNNIVSNYKGSLEVLIYFFLSIIPSHMPPLASIALIFTKKAFFLYHTMYCYSFTLGFYSFF
jgi:ABC-type tungstate transport system substrate-binding protein